MHRDAFVNRRGFTLIEIMITLMVLGVVMLGLMQILQVSLSSQTGTGNRMEARQFAAASLEMITADLRGAGSGNDWGYATPQPAIAYCDSMELMLCGDFSGSVTAPVDTLGYNPAGTPKPNKLAGSWAPPIKYRTGAELIRWTMDVNNDGAETASDNSNANGIDALRSRNPNDFELVRQIYGDSLNEVAADNGGAISRVAMIRKPGAGVPPIYTVNFTDGTTWDWSSGAVPANKLSSIASIKLQITAESRRPDPRGRYAQVTLSSTVNVSRIAP